MPLTVPRFEMEKAKPDFPIFEPWKPSLYILGQCYQELLNLFATRSQAVLPFQSIDQSINKSVNQSINKLYWSITGISLQEIHLRLPAISSANLEKSGGKMEKEHKRREG